jgi:CTP synthase
MGRVFSEIREKERRGDYLGKTVQYVPHVTDHIKAHLHRVAVEHAADVLLVEVGGTVGDIETELFLEACRQLKGDVGADRVLYVHLTYVPVLDAVGEPKSKPTQQSVALLRERGIQPDVIIGRCRAPLPDALKRKIAQFCDVPDTAVISGVDVDSVYRIPASYAAQGMVALLERKFAMTITPRLDAWESLLTAPPTMNLRIALCGKYTALEDSYASVIEALRHAAAHARVALDVRWIETTDLEGPNDDVAAVLRDIDGVIVPGGFGARGIEGKIRVITYCREHNIPYLGLCYGMQLAVIEYARNVCGLAGAHTTEIDPRTPHPVIDLLPGQRGITTKGATMRLGGNDVHLRRGTRAHELLGDVARLRFRHRYEVNPLLVTTLEMAGLVFSGANPDGTIMQVVELPRHPFFFGTQAHPELTSSLDHPSPFFRAFVRAACECVASRAIAL